MEYVNYETKERVAYITINRPDKRNALNAQVVDELKQGFEHARTDQAAKVVVLQAAGKVFCAGADLAYIQQLQKNTYEENLADSSHLKELFYQIYTHPKVVIGKIHGHAIAGGAGLAAVCDHTITTPAAKFGYTEVRIGFVAAIVMAFLLRKIPEGKARELLLSGELIDAQQAVSIGLINALVTADGLNDAVHDYAQMLIDKNSGQSMAMTKTMIAALQHMPIEDGLQYAAQQNANARATDDCKKGIASFLDKTTPVW